MHLQLNKIDTDLRRKVYEQTRDGKIHSKSEVIITKDSEKNREKDFKKLLEEEKENLRKNKEHKKENDEITVQCEIDLNSMKLSVGNFVDVKR